MSPGCVSGVVVTAEHACFRLPARYATLGLEPRLLRSHIGWDEGSLELARTLARRLSAPLLAGRWSRLLIDLNRSPRHRNLIPEVAFGHPIPGNRNLSSAERERRLDAYYRPFRERAQRWIDDAAARGRCLHLSVHTFTPRLGGCIRRADCGILYDPSRLLERRLAARLARALRAAGFVARRNYPYRGVADGHVVAHRRRLPPERYLGLELELNQALLGDWKSVVAKFSAVVEDQIQEFNSTAAPSSVARSAAAPR